MRYPVFDNQKSQAILGTVDWWVMRDSTYPWQARHNIFANKFARVDSLADCHWQPSPLPRVEGSNLLGNQKSQAILGTVDWWVMRDSNPRPPRCKRDALAN